MVQLDKLLTLPGILNLAQVLAGFASLFATSVIWYGGNLQIQIFFAYYGWQFFIQLLVLALWIVAVGTLMCNLMGSDIYGSIGKLKTFIVYGVCLVLAILAGSLQAWYADKANTTGNIYRARFIAACIFDWIVAIAYVALLVINLIFGS